MRITILIFLALLLTLPYAFAECRYSADINLNIEAIENRELSPYQFPSFRESDFLAIKDLTIKNIGNCMMERPDFVILLESPTGVIDQPFCISRFFVPVNLTPNDTYAIYRAPIGNVTHRYLDSIGREDYHCFTELDALGRWEITARPTPASTNPTNPTGWNFRANGVFLSNVSFRVYSNTELSLLDLAKESNNLAFWAVVAAAVSVIIAIASIIHSEQQLKKDIEAAQERQKEQFDFSNQQQQKQFEFQEKRHLENQINLLRSLLTELKTVKEDTEGYKTELKRNGIPLYEIKVIDVNFYSKNLDYKIPNANYLPVGTEELKKNLFKIYDKAKLINFYLKWLHEQQYNPAYWDTKFMTGQREKIVNEFYPKVADVLPELEKFVEEAQKILAEKFNI